MEYEEENEELEIMTRDLEMLKETISNLNFTIDFLKQSNKNLTMEMMNLESDLDEKNEVITLFLQKHNMSLEDVLEFEMELKTNNSIKINKKNKKVQ
jgi:cupin superfamily acireductone dioxygenase involved in methionine salvage